MTDRRRKAPVTPIRRGKATRTTKLTVAQAVERGDQRAVLVALRDLIAAKIGEASPRDVIGLSRRLLDVNADLSGLDAAAAAEVEAAELAAPPWSPDQL
jgi:hypothetical protein